MSRASIPATTVTRAGVEHASYQRGSAATGHRIVANDGNLVLEAFADGGSAIGVTLRPTLQVHGLALAAEEVEVTGGGTLLIGPIPPAIYNQTDESVHVDVGADGVLLRVYRF